MGEALVHDAVEDERAVYALVERARVEIRVFAKVEVEHPFLNLLITGEVAGQFDSKLSWHS